MGFATWVASVIGLALASVLPAALTATCQVSIPVPGSAPVTGTDHCYEAAMGGYPYAMASSAVGDDSSGNEFDVQFNQGAFGSAPGIYNDVTSASATATISLELTTTGPVRPGYVAVINKGLSGGQYDGTGSLGINIGNYQVASCSIFDAQTGLCGGLPKDLTLAEAGGYTPMPITLGESLSFGETQTVGAEGDPVDGEGSAEFSSVIALEFFDSDGKTPVAVTESTVPEPISAAMFALGGLLLLGLNRLRTGKSRNGSSGLPC